MKQPSVISVLLLLVATLGLATASDQDQAAQVLSHFFEASGGLEKVRGTQSISATASFEAYPYPYTMHLLADGRFRVEAPDRTTVFDGEKYWQSFHGVVQELTGSDIDRYRDLGLREDIFHGFIDAAGNPARIEYGGQETKRGQVYDLLSRTTSEGNRRTYYVNATTGLVDKMVELAPDPDFRELKTVFTYADYEDFGGLRLPTLFQAQCLTNGEQPQPLTRFEDIEVNARLDPALFAKPESEAPAASLSGGALSGEVLAISGGGSLITNITAGDLNGLGASDGTTLLAEVRGREQQLSFMNDLEAFGDIGPGDYLATFNGTPTLWLVKAYQGYISDDSTYAAGDRVRLTVSAQQ